MRLTTCSDRSFVIGCHIPRGIFLRETFCQASRRDGLKKISAKVSLEEFMKQPGNGSPAWLLPTN
jgi:hypothetical protein